MRQASCKVVKTIAPHRRCKGMARQAYQTTGLWLPYFRAVLHPGCAAGGTVLGPNGASVVIPAGALTNEVRINIEQVTGGSLVLPAGYTAYGLMFAYMPHGTTFAMPVTMTLPFDPAAVPAGAVPTFYKTTNAQTQWDEIPNASFGANSVSVQVTSFSDATAVIPPL
jgi:hypothetical protein